MPLVFECTIAANQVVAARRVVKADGFWARTRGLIGQANLALGEGLWLAPCRQIHTFLMRFPIDVVFIDKSGVVIRIYTELQPSRLTALIWRAASVLELPAGGSSNIAVGDEMIFREVAP